MNRDESYSRFEIFQALENGRLLSLEKRVPARVENIATIFGKTFWLKIATSRRNFVVGDHQIFMSRHNPFGYLKFSFCGNTLQRFKESLRKVTSWELEGFWRGWKMMPC